MTKFFAQYKKIHFVGIGGIGISGLARLALKHGVTVSGSDISESATTQLIQQEGGRVFMLHSGDNVPASADLLVYSSAVPKDNPELKTASAFGMPIKSYFEALGELSKSYVTFAVTGMHGKSTTTALTGLILESAGYDPTVIVGTKVPHWGGNVRFGNSSVLVVEACEYRAHMKHIDADVLILTNIDAEHLDYYKNIEHVEDEFRAYLQQLAETSGNGEQKIVVFNKDDARFASLMAPLSEFKKVSYSLASGADFSTGERLLNHSAKRQQFEVVEEGVLKGRVTLQIPGDFNIVNALAAIAACRSFGISFDICKKAVSGYKGAWRRFEYVGKVQGALLYSDYAHHPTEIKATLLAVRSFYPYARLVVVFQPHQRHRTHSLFHDFVSSFDGADFLVLLDIYDVAGRDETITQDIGYALFEKIVQRGKTPVEFARTLEQAHACARAHVQKGDVLLILGAGTVDGLARDMIKEESSESVGILPPCIKHNEPLAPHTTFKIGGPARYFAEVKDMNDLKTVRSFAQDHHVSCVVISGGSNVLISEKGFDGMVIKMNFTDIAVDREHALVSAGAGVSMSGLSQECAAAGLSGLEFGIAIPGKVGGSIFGNAGCYGNEMKDVVRRVLVLQDREMLWLNVQECEFSYRESIFKRNRQWVILKAEFILHKKKKEVILARIKELLDDKKQSQPLGKMAAGSIFKNPPLADGSPPLLLMKRECGEAPPIKNGRVAAWWLIDKAGLRGARVGGAEVSHKHANFIVNSGNATASDVRSLISLIHQTVYKKHTVSLVEEIQYIGDE